MVLVARKDSEHSFILPDKQAEKLGLEKGKEYELLKVREGFFVLYESKPEKALKREEKPKREELDKKIISTLKEKKLPEKVEGKFEEFLNPEEKKRFKEMIKEGKIVPFKLSEKYKKAIYKTRDELKKSKKPPVKKKEVEKPKKKTKKAPLKPVRVPPEPESGEKGSYSLERDDFTVVSSEGEAKRICRELRDQIKNREVLGTKSFNGDYFVIKSDLYEKHSPEVLNLIKNNSPITLNELSKQLNLNRQLIKAVCEFLKEEGEITEKRKELYEFVP